ncbi:MAG: xanthine dehydrogenase family protein molybdopterin-binding subunit [Anaerolineae bacterium]|jgi:CO/xanthine dehydrogenase Mo-binding subunit|nr:xanthine dehydrogenase family protein molybdopterin-binding subunit [Anaerolineae bacterium]
MNGNNQVTAVGANARRIDAPGKVTGATLYPGDIDYPHMLHMATLFAHRVHARVVSVDTTAAESAPGVVLVLTAKDVPVNEYGLQIKDQPVLCGPGGEKPGTDIVRFVGDQLVLVVAETEAEARAACKLITVEWEDLPAVLDPEEAMGPGALQLHPHSKDNVCYSYRIRKGDVDRAFGEADVIVEGVYQTPVQEHAYLQPEAGVARWDDDGRITVEVAGQWTHVDQEQIAHALALPVDRVRVIYPAIGGAFGGREDMSVQITLALCVMRLAEKGIKRPVKTIWSREESMFGHGKRHAMKLYAKWGAKRDGTLVAVQVKAIADGGAYMYTSNKVLGNTTLTCTGPYEIPNVAVDTYAVYTNHVPGAAFRGFGGPQGHFEAEGQMDKLAEALGMDPVELRLKNILTDDKLLTVGTPIPGGVGLTAVVTTAAKAAGWEQDETGRWRRPNLKFNADDADGVDQQDSLKDHGNPPDQRHLRSIPSTVRRGIGFAAGFKNVGFSFGYQENSYARVEVRGAAEMAQADVFFAGADCGQGNHTIIAQAAAEVLGIPLEKVCVIASDTAQMGNAGSASASRLTYMSANAVKGAAEKALAAWKNEDRPAVGEHVYLAPKTTPLDHDTGYGKPNFAYGYTAQAVQVAVDTETGQVKIEKFICADDVGKAINPQQVVGQIEGAVVQALGYTLLEDWKTKDGRVLTDKLSTYLIPTVLDVPEQMESIIVEVPDPNGPWGARGMGEVPYLPVASAVAAAVYDAVGVRYDEFPLTPERVWAGLRRQA